VVIGAIVLAALILMVLLAERGSDWMWAGRADLYFYCRYCDLRYPRSELPNPVAMICPHGHVTEKVPTDFPVGTVLIYTCLGFIGFGLVLVATGVVHTP
jgi:hypothetical protein